MTTFEGLREILIRDYRIPPERLTPETPLPEIDIDSLAAMELVFSLEERYGVTVGATDPAAFATLGEIAAYIDARIAARDADIGRSG